MRLPFSLGIYTDRLRLPQKTCQYLLYALMLKDNYLNNCLRVLLRNQPELKSVKGEQSLKHSQSFLICLEIVFLHMGMQGD